MHDYLVQVALKHPNVFVPALSKIIPLEVNMRGNGNITIQIVKSDDQSRPESTMKLVNGHANGSATNGSGNGTTSGSNDPAAE